MLKVWNNAMISQKNILKLSKAEKKE